MSSRPLILGTRGSELALKQTEMVTAVLQAAHPGLVVERKIIQTSGDKRQDLRFSEFADVAQVDKGIFIKELEIALEKGEIDAAVARRHASSSAAPSSSCPTTWRCRSSSVTSRI
jgi:hydroxymethylbilane synthase